MELASLILTAKLDPESFRVFDELRRKHFPPERNFLPAHVTLFHKLPGEALNEICDELDRVSADASTVAAAFPSLIFLGRGVAVEVESPGLVRLRKHLADRWADDLSPQDAEKFRPHITIQNKVRPAAARALFAELNLSLQILEGSFTGLELWHYEGGPWRLEREFPFASAADRNGSALGAR